MSESLKTTLKDHSEFRSDIEDHTPLNRIAAAGELAEAAQYLACDASSFMTGQVITVDGGRTLLDPVAAPAH
jgi:7-alpha-hydroxysteroid dehydrogenase